MMEDLRQRQRLLNGQAVCGGLVGKKQFFSPVFLTGRKTYNVRGRAGWESGSRRTLIFRSQPLVTL